MMNKTFTIGIVGYGLIGGSFGLGLKKYTDNYVIAIDKNKDVLDYVVKNNLADEASDVDFNVLSKCDILYIALYPEAILDFVEDYMDCFKENAIVIDLCGIKKFVVEKFGHNINQKFRFLGTHPMAGKEKNGITASDADLYRGASYLITKTETTDDEALNIAIHLAKKIGFDNIIITDDENHDKMITYTSQLPHIMSVAYIMQNAHDKCFGYYAGSFKDMTRVADINSPLWTQLFKHNKEILTSQIDEYIEALNTIKKSINEDDDSLLNILYNSKKKKEWQDENYKY